jgi:hypothetical protein
MKKDHFPYRNKGLVLLVGIMLALLPFTGSGQNLPESTKPVKVFASITGSNGTNTYYSADLTQLPEFFERAFLLDLLFANPKLVVNNSNINGKSLEIFSSSEFDSAQVLNTLQVFHDEAAKANREYSDVQKKELLKKYEKYK